MNKKTLVLTALLLLQTISASAYTPSTWAKEEIASAKKAGITVFEDFNKDYTQALNREEICALIVQTLETGLGKKLEPKNSSPFTDTENEDIICAYELGVIDGTGEGEFMPQKQLSRQEASKIFGIASEKLTENTVKYNENAAVKFKDFSSVAPWAVKYVSAVSENGLFKGDENGNFNPLSGVTVEQAAVICLRMLNSAKDADSGENGYIKSDFKISAKTGAGTAKINWNCKTDCTVKIYEQRNSYYEGEFDANLTEILTDKNQIEFSVNPNKTYTVDIFSADGKKDSVTFVTDNFTIDREHREDVKEIVNTFTSEEDSSAAMKTLTVKVWQIKDGKKQPSELTVTVLDEIADKVEAVFDEIFSGKEQFPIYSLGAYAWRAPMSSGRYSEHNFGTAIDINPNENYCLYSDGSTVGECYKPYENPYSITPYGDVVRAFEKYGFTWGADSWRSPKDYMHFSYLGT